MKRLNPLIFSLALVGAVLLWTSVFGGVFDLRQPPVRVPLSVMRADVTLGYVDLTVRNHELYPMTVETWYALIDPATGAAVYTSPAQRVPVLAARTNTVVSLPIPPEYDAAAYRVTAGAREVIAYADQSAPRLLIEGGLVASEDELSVQGVQILALGGGRYGVNAELAFAAQRDGDYRYAITLIPVTEAEDGELIPGDEAFRTPFAPLALTADAPTTRTVSGEAALAPGRYSLSLWLQAAFDDGSFEHYAQATYPRLIDVAGS